MKNLWITIKNYLIKFAVQGLVKAGKTAEAKSICYKIIREIEDKEIAK